MYILVGEDSKYGIFMVLLHPVQKPFVCSPSPLLMVCWYVVAGIPLVYKRIKK
jgi:hypothetical protein